MVKTLILTKKKSIPEILEEAGVKIDPVKVEMTEFGDTIVLTLKEEVSEVEVSKLENYFKNKGYKKVTDEVLIKLYCNSMESLPS